MKGFKKCLLVCMAFIWCLPAWVDAVQDRTVMAEGVGAIFAGDEALARDRAIKDAQRKAVELSVGVLIDSETITQNYSVIRDEIYARSVGYIQDYKVLGESKEEGLVRVSLQATVRMRPLKEDLDRVIVRVGKPRVLFMIAEQDIGGNAPVAWWQGTSGMGQFVVDASLQQYFLSKSFVVVDHSLKKPRRKLSPNPSDSEAAALGHDYDAEVVIVGRAVAKDAGKIANFNLHSCRAEISARAIQVDNGHVLAAESARAAAAHIDPMTGGNEALQKASDLLSKKLADQVIAAWARQVSDSSLITLDITNVGRYADFVKLKGVLKDQVRGVSTVYQRSFAEGKAKLEVDYQGTAQELADELALKEFEAFNIRILEASQNRLKIAIAPRPM